MHSFFVKLIALLVLNFKVAYVEFDIYTLVVASPRLIHTSL